MSVLTRAKQRGFFLTKESSSANDEAVNAAWSSLGVGVVLLIWGLIIGAPAMLWIGGALLLLGALYFLAQRLRYTPEERDRRKAGLSVEDHPAAQPTRLHREVH